MKAEAWFFAICTMFFLLVAPAYWFITYDWTGTSALTMTFLLTLLVTFYLGFHARRPRWPRGVRNWPRFAARRQGPADAPGHRPGACVLG